jgi:hypothetical protein
MINIPLFIALIVFLDALLDIVTNNYSPRGTTFAFLVGLIYFINYLNHKSSYRTIFWNKLMKKLKYDPYKIYACCQLTHIIYPIAIALYIITVLDTIFTTDLTFIQTLFLFPVVFVVIIILAMGTIVIMTVLDIILRYIFNEAIHIKSLNDFFKQLLETYRALFTYCKPDLIKILYVIDFECDKRIQECEKVKYVNNKDK